MAEPDFNNLAEWLRSGRSGLKPRPGGEMLLPFLALGFGLAALLCLWLMP